MTSFGKAVVVIVCLGLCALMLAFAASCVEARDVTLAWDPNTEPDVKFYTVYQADTLNGTTGPWQSLGSVDHPIATYTAIVPDVGNFAWHVTATDESGNESHISNVVYLYDRVAPAGPANLTKQ